ncbi:MAG TPA: hypothetical protein VFJ76_07885 [Solirubrobacterales bacterium]|nr:hypothetical protein [Solirubrobacterales bacterium]
MKPHKAYISGLEDGLQGISLHIENASKRYIRAYRAGVKRGKAWRHHIEDGKFGWPDAATPQPKDTHLSGDGERLPDPQLTREEAKLLLGARDPEPIEHPNCAARERARGKLRIALATRLSGNGETLEESAERLRQRVLAHPVITTMDESHRDRVRIALEGAGLKVAVAELLATRLSPENSSGKVADCDDLCKCGHERFHHDDGREMGVETNCKSRGCTCQKFEAENSSGVEEELRKQLDLLVGAAAPIESGEGGEEDRENFSEVFQDACFLLARLQVKDENAASPQPDPTTRLSEGTGER